MQTIFYRHESDAARKFAEAAGLPYPGRGQLNVMHVAMDSREIAKAAKTIEEIRAESDYFSGYSQTELVSKGF